MTRRKRSGSRQGGHWGWAILMIVVIWAVVVCAFSAAFGDEPTRSTPTPATPSLEDRETTWTKYLAAKYHWRDDVRAWDGSLPDLVTATHAIEVDWAKHKWKEAIGQAFDYAATTSKKPGVLLLVKDLDSEKSDLYRAERACREAGVLLLIYDCKFDRWLMPVDADSLPQGKASGAVNVDTLPPPASVDATRGRHSVLVNPSVAKLLGHGMGTGMRIMPESSFLVLVIVALSLVAAMLVIRLVIYILDRFPGKR